MRQIFFRLSAIMLGATFIWILAIGGLNQFSILKRILTGGLAIVFLLYGLGAERVADFVLAQMFGISSTKPQHPTTSPIDPFDARSESDRD